MAQEKARTYSQKAQNFVELAKKHGVLVQTPVLNLGRIGTSTSDRFSPKFSEPYTTDLTTRIGEEDGFITATIEPIVRKRSRLDFINNYFNRNSQSGVDLIAIGYQRGDDNEDDGPDISVIFTPMEQLPNRSEKLELFPIISKARFFIPSRPVPLDLLDWRETDSADLLYKSVVRSLDKSKQSPSSASSREIEYSWNLFLDRNKNVLSPTIRLAIATGLTNF